MRAAPSNDGNGQAARRRRPILRGGSRSHYSHINIVIVADHDDHLPLNVCTHPDDIGDDDLRLECRGGEDSQHWIISWAPWNVVKRMLSEIVVISGQLTSRPVSIF